MNEHSGVYEIRNMLNGKRYIGSAVNTRQRWINHRGGLCRQVHHSVKLQRAWNKYGESAFVFRVIQPCPVSQLRFQEQRAIHGFMPEYNIAKVAGAPMQGRRHNEDTRSRMTKKLKGNTRATGYKYTLEQRAARSALLTGRKYSAEACANISAAKKGKNVAKRGPMPQAQRNAISAAKMGKKQTAEQRAAKAARQLGKKRKPHTPETRALLSTLKRARDAARASA